jgi:hypothetical protein
MRCNEPGAKRFSLMSHWLYSMIGFGKRHKFKKETKNVV